MPLSKSKIKYIQSLKEKKFRDEFGTFVAEGDKMVADLLPVMECEMLVATTSFIASKLKSGYPIKDIIEVSHTELERASFLKTPQQVLAVFRRPNYTINIEAMNRGLNLVLDGIQDPGNLGTIVRLADWFGIEHIICSKDTVDVFNTKVVQATMGALARVKVYYTDLPDFLRSIKGAPVYGTFLEGSDLYSTEITGKGYIIMGNEGNGIRPDVQPFVTDKLYIPNYPKGRTATESLNVAIATAVICSEFRRRNL